MDTLVRTTADELNASLIDFIKKTFRGKKIAVHIYEDNEMDETEYLLNDPQQKKELLKAAEEVKENRNLKIYTMEELEQQFLKEPEA